MISSTWHVTMPHRTRGIQSTTKEVELGQCLFLEPESFLQHSIDLKILFFKRGAPKNCISPILLYYALINDVSSVKHFHFSVCYLRIPPTMKGPVAVSGVSGYIGAQVAKHLLEGGYKVHGTVRQNTPEKLSHLTDLAQGEHVVVFEADLLDEGSFDNAVVGCTGAFHVASPYTNTVSDPQKELVDPAVKGTLNFLNACKKAGVPKVIVTSSVAAITDGGEPKGKILTEDDWNDHSTLNFLPYYYSKVCAERAAWDFVKGSDIKLITINPGAVIGPSLIPSLGESASLIKMLQAGSILGSIDFSLPSVDVRDVADAHILAFESETAEGRYICCADGPPLHMRETTAVLKDMGYNMRELDLTSSTFSWLIRASGHIVPGTQGQIMRRYVGTPTIVSNDKILRDLGITFRKLNPDVLKDTINDMIKWGHLPSPPRA